MISVAILRQMN